MRISRKSKGRASTHSTSAGATYTSDWTGVRALIILTRMRFVSEMYVCRGTTRRELGRKARTRCGMARADCVRGFLLSQKCHNKAVQDPFG
jgi:hypothetical protein